MDHAQFGSIKVEPFHTIKPGSDPDQLVVGEDNHGGSFVHDENRPDSKLLAAVYDVQKSNKGGLKHIIIVDVKTGNSVKVTLG